MSNANSKPNQYSSDEAKLIIEIVEGTLKNIFRFLMCHIHFFQKKRFLSKYFLIFSLCNITVCFKLIYRQRLHLDYLYSLFPNLVKSAYGEIFYWKYNLGQHAIVAFLILQALYIFVTNIGEIITKEEFKENFDKVQWGTIKPRVSRIKQIGKKKYLVRVFLNNLAFDVIKKQEDAIQSALNMYVISMKRDKKNLNYCEIVISKYQEQLKKRYDYDEFLPLLKKPFHFFAGISEEGPILVDIMSLPHMMIAGTTDGGKSVFTNQVLLSLLISSGKHLRLNLIDLKHGVEFTDYSNLKNVRIATDLEKSVKILKEVEREMIERFEYLQKSGKRKINPIKDKMPLIVVAIDEASELFDSSLLSKLKDDESKESVNLISEALKSTDKLAKQARAVGIHLIVATQKIIIDTLPTKIRSNLQGRMCFRVESQEDSRTILGCGMGAEIPDIKGRAVWRQGNKKTVVQSLYVSDFDIQNHIGDLIQAQDDTDIQSIEPVSSQTNLSTFNPIYSGETDL